MIILSRTTPNDVVLPSINCRVLHVQTCKRDIQPCPILHGPSATAAAAPVSGEANNMNQDGVPGSATQIRCRKFRLRRNKHEVNQGSAILDAFFCSSILLSPGLANSYPATSFTQTKAELMSFYPTFSRRPPPSSAFAVVQPIDELTCQSIDVIHSSQLNSFSV